ncbi:hypothetical protein [Vulgatibacter sp.]|uniref:hypothetical protein n=1 Tax=Vulgatibacter sp. TaxID=1971226 RepID=UPI0035629D43
MNHPSYLELDRHALGEYSAAVEAHVGSCPRCSAHLASVQPTEAALPAWARQAPPRRFRLPRFRWIGGFALAGATAAATLLLLPAPVEPPPYVAPKGMPSVALYVLRDGRTTLWNGTEPLRPGDRIRLKVAPEGFAWLAVSTRAADGSFGTLHHARIDPAVEYLLPESWRLDDAPGPERIHVALDAAPTDPEGAAWTTTLEIPKAAR